MLTTLLSNYVATGRLVLASWQQDLKTREKALEQVSSNFTSSGKLSLPQNLMWNVIMYCVFVMALFPSTQMSQDMYRFTCLHFLAPLLVGHLTFYRYRFGSKLWTHLTPTSWVVWTSHFAAVTGVALAGLTPTAALYIAGLVVDPYLPESCRGHVHFSLQDHERSLQASVYFFLDFGRGSFGHLARLEAWVRTQYVLCWKTRRRVHHFLSGTGYGSPVSNIRCAFDGLFRDALYHHRSGKIWVARSFCAYLHGGHGWSLFQFYPPIQLQHFSRVVSPHSGLLQYGASGTSHAQIHLSGQFWDGLVGRLRPRRFCQFCGRLSLCGAVLWTPTDIWRPFLHSPYHVSLVGIGPLASVAPHGTGGHLFQWCSLGH